MTGQQQRMVVEKFICMLRHKSPIWNPRDANHRTSNVVTNCWDYILFRLVEAFGEEILSVMNMDTVDDLKKKYHGLRSTMLKEKRKRNEKSPWVWSRHLAFLDQEESNNVAMPECLPLSTTTDISGLYSCTQLVPMDDIPAPLVENVPQSSSLNSMTNAIVDPGNQVRCDITPNDNVYTFWEPPTWWDPSKRRSKNKDPLHIYGNHNRKLMADYDKDEDYYFMKFISCQIQRLPERKKNTIRQQIMHLVTTSIALE